MIDLNIMNRVNAKFAFEPGDKSKVEEIWLGVWKTLDADAKSKGRETATDDYIAARMAFLTAYLDHGIKGPLATTALAAVGL